MFLIGLLSGIVFFVVIALSVYIGYRLGHKTKRIKADDDEKREAEQLRRDFVKLMNYDVTTALQPRKKV